MPRLLLGSVANKQDPVLYRLYEVLVVYGFSYKALIHEKVRRAPSLSCLLLTSNGTEWDLADLQFGDGIMSAIDFRTSVTRKADPKGDRVVITLDGKFLNYSTPEVWGR